MTQLTTAPTVRTNRGPSVALVRGEALNPFEMQAYAPLLDRLDLLAVGRRRPRYEVSQVPMPIALLRSIATYPLPSRIYRRVRSQRMMRLDQDMLWGLRKSVAGREILNSAETVLPVAEQCALISQRKQVPLVLTCSETIPFRYDDDPVLAARKLVTKAAASRYIAVTELAKRALVIEGVAHEQITVIPWAVDCERFRPGQPSPELKAAWGVPTDSPVVLYIGRLIQEKGVVELVRAFARAERAGDPHLVFVGSGTQQDRIRIAAKALGIEHRVHVLPGVSYRDLPRHYATADLVVAPSLTTPYWEEQFGMVLAEALACGRPLITTESGAIPEVVGEAARLVPPYDVDALSEALSALLASETECKRLGAAGRERALRRYGVPVVAEQLATVYEDPALTR
jgi:alpha-maltose-1-phosphate synthase